MAGVTAPLSRAAWGPLAGQLDRAGLAALLAGRKGYGDEVNKLAQWVRRNYHPLWRIETDLPELAAQFWWGLDGCGLDRADIERTIVDLLAKRHDVDPDDRERLILQELAWLHYDICGRHPQFEPRFTKLAWLARWRRYS